MADLGVDYGQGFAMGKAQPLEDLLQELAIYEATVSDWAASAGRAGIQIDHPRAGTEHVRRVSAILQALATKPITCRSTP